MGVASPSRRPAAGGPPGRRRRHVGRAGAPRGVACRAWAQRGQPSWLFVGFVL